MGTPSNRDARSKKWQVEKMDNNNNCQIWVSRCQIQTVAKGLSSWESRLSAWKSRLSAWNSHTACPKLPQPMERQIFK